MNKFNANKILDNLKELKEYYHSKNMEKLIDDLHDSPRTLSLVAKKYLEIINQLIGVIELTSDILIQNQETITKAEICITVLQARINNLKNEMH